MYKKIISIITLITTTFIRCGKIDVKLPDNTMTQITMDNPIVNRPATCIAAVSKNAVEAIKGTLGKLTDELIPNIAQYAAPMVPITDIGVLQDILAAVNLQIGEMQIGEIKEFVQLDDITSKIIYYHYSVSKDIFNVLHINQSEKELKVISTVKTGVVEFKFSSEKYIIECHVRTDLSYNYESQDIRELLTSKNYLHCSGCPNSIDLYIRFDPDNQRNQFFGWGKIESNNRFGLGLINQYTVLQRIALIIAAADLVKEGKDINREAFLKSFSSNLASFKHPSIYVSVNTQKYT